MLIQFALTLELISSMKFTHYSYKDKKSHKSTLGGRVLCNDFLYDISLIGTQGKQPATKTRQDSLFTSKRSEAAMRSETCAEPTQSAIFYAGKILFFINAF